MRNWTGWCLLAVGWFCLINIGCSGPASDGQAIGEVDRNDRTDVEENIKDASHRAADDHQSRHRSVSIDPAKIRFATFNIHMAREKSGEMANELASGDCEQAEKICKIIADVRPDVLLICELDQPGRSLSKFESYIRKTDSTLEFNYRFHAPFNTGEPSGVDFNNDGKSDGPADAFGFGKFPGQYGMVVLSRYPIDKKNVRTFQKFLWKDMPGMKWPTHPKTGKSFYSDKAKKIFRLSSKSHWDIPIQIGKQTIHFLVCHPTPPGF